MTCLTQGQPTACRWVSLRSQRRRPRPRHQRKFNLMKTRWAGTRKKGSQSITQLSHRSEGRWLLLHHEHKDRARLWWESLSCCRVWRMRSINTMMQERPTKGIRHWSSIAKLPMRQLKIWIYKKKEIKVQQWRYSKIVLMWSRKTRISWTHFLNYIMKLSTIWHDVATSRVTSNKVWPFWWKRWAMFGHSRRSRSLDPLQSFQNWAWTSAMPIFTSKITRQHFHMLNRPSSQANSASAALSGSWTSSQIQRIPAEQNKRGSVSYIWVRSTFIFKDTRPKDRPMRSSRHTRKPFVNITRQSKW